MASNLTKLIYHFVFSTRNRRPLLLERIRPDLLLYMGGVARELRCRLITWGGIEDHVHLQVIMPPTVLVSELLRRIKGSSSRWMNEQRRQTERFSWQRGYGAFTVSESRVDAVARYIRSQAEHHRRLGFRDEMLQLMEVHRIPVCDAWD